MGCSSSQEAQGTGSGITNCFPGDITSTNPPGWCRRAQDDADAWPTKPSSALLPCPNFLERSPSDSPQHQQRASQTQPNPTAPKCWYLPWPASKSRCVPSYPTSVFAAWVLLSFPSHISTSWFRWEDVKAPYVFLRITTPWVAERAKKWRLHVKLQLKVGFSSDMNSMQASYLLKTDETSPNSFWIAKLLTRPGGV